MTRAQLRTAGIALLALLAFPRAGSAGIFDIIWEMSGPRMIGLIVLQCEYDLENKTTECRAADKRLYGAPGARAMRRTWVSFDTAIYTSTGRDSSTAQYDPNENHMVVFEPMLSRRIWTPNDNFSVHHGLIGASYNYLFGATKFHKGGFKFTPVGVTIFKRINAAYHLRVYPTGFTAQEFGATSLLPVMHPGREFVQGFSVGFYLDKD